MGEQNVYPGPVDNSGLLKGKKKEAQKIKPAFCWPSFTFKTTLLDMSFCSGQKGTKANIVYCTKGRLFGSFGDPSSIPLFFFSFFYTQWDKCQTNICQRLLSAFLFAAPFSLLDGDVLAIKEHLIDELDYILVPTEGWIKLVSWYGLTDGQESIARKVILSTIWLSVINVITPINAIFCCWEHYLGIILVCTLYLTECVCIRVIGFRKHEKM